MKKYKDHERPKGVCYDCRKPYSLWSDFSVDDDVWEQINPTYHEGAGLLCQACIENRISNIKKYSRERNERKN